MGDPTMPGLSKDAGKKSEKKSLGDFAKSISRPKMESPKVKPKTKEQSSRDIASKRKELDDLMAQSEIAKDRKTGRRMKAVKYEKVAGDDELVFSDEAVGSETEVATISPEVAESERVAAIDELGLDTNRDVMPEVSEEISELEQRREAGPTLKTNSDRFQFIKEKIEGMTIPEGGLSATYEEIVQAVRDRGSAIPFNMKKDVEKYLRNQRTLRGERPSGSEDFQGSVVDAAKTSSGRIEAKYSQESSTTETPKKRGRIRRFFSRSNK